MAKIFNLFDTKQKVDYKVEILAGLTVAMTMIPESLSFAIIAGFHPLMGLYAAIITGFVTAIFGGRPGMISGGAGATVIVLIALMKSHGLDYVLAAVALAGVFQILVGVFKLGIFIRLVPHSVMFGFVNGLAIIIFLSQMDQFKTLVNNQTVWLTGTPMLIMLGLVALTIVIVLFFSKITKAIPSSLVAIILVFLLVYFFNIDTKTVKDIASVSGGFPPFKIPDIPFNLNTLQIIFPYAMIMAAVGLTEGLLTLNLVDEITETKGNGNRECLAQGSANILNGFFFGMGGCPMIAQTLVNLSAGSRARLSGIIASLAILAIVLFGAPLIEQVPMAALVGVMIMVAIGTFEWVSLKIFNKMPLHDVLLVIIVTAITVILHNLALAVLIGVIISALIFSWESAKRIRAKKYIDDAGAKHYDLFGPLFFASTAVFLEKFDVKNDPDTVIIDFSESRIVDMSAIEALNVITERYNKVNKKVYLSGLSNECKRLINRAEKIVNITVLD
jgi:SulP family sulfate permease